MSGQPAATSAGTGLGHDMSDKQSILTGLSESLPKLLADTANAHPDKVAPTAETNFDTSSLAASEDARDGLESGVSGGVAGRQQQNRASLAETVLGACAPAEAFQSAPIRMPSRDESVDVIHKLTLQERFEQLKEAGRLPERFEQLKEAGGALNATVMRCYRDADASVRKEMMQKSKVTSSNSLAADPDKADPGTVDDETESMQIENEMEQLERMISWNTHGTFDTMQTEGTADTSATKASGGVNALGEIGLPPTEKVLDDDGNEIRQGVLKDLQRRRSQRFKAKKSPSRKKKAVVQFDYPPISSLREYPRTDPKKKSELFFTEEELDQIEDDRASCRMADDVEVVAVATVPTVPRVMESEEGEKKVSKRQARKNMLAKNKKSTSVNSSAATVDGAEHASPGRTGGNSVRRKRSGRNGERSATPLPETFAILDVGSEDSAEAEIQAQSSKSGNSGAGVVANLENSSSSPGDAESPQKSKESMLQGIQIYLRHRSTYD